MAIGFGTNTHEPPPQERDNVYGFIPGLAMSGTYIYNPEIRAFVFQQPEPQDAYEVDEDY